MLDGATAKSILDRQFVEVLIAPDYDVQMLLDLSSTVEEAGFDVVEIHGAHGYLLKNVKPEALFQALRGVIAGEAAISRATAKACVCATRHSRARIL